MQNSAAVTSQSNSVDVNTLRPGLNKLKTATTIATVVCLICIAVSVVFLALALGQKISITAPLFPLAATLVTGALIFVIDYLRVCVAKKYYGFSSDQLSQYDDVHYPKPPPKKKNKEKGKAKAEGQ